MGDWQNESMIDYATGLRRFAGHAALYEKFLFKYLDDKNFEMLRTALDAKDYQSAFRAVHTLKGVAGNLSLTEVYENCCTLVEALRAGDNEQAEPLYEILKEKHLAALEMIRAHKGI